jgi:hypothetical protein
LPKKIKTGLNFVMESEYSYSTMANRGSKKITQKRNPLAEDGRVKPASSPQRKMSKPSQLQAPLQSCSQMRLEQIMEDGEQNTWNETGARKLTNSNLSAVDRATSIHGQNREPAASSAPRVYSFISSDAGGNSDCTRSYSEEESVSDGSSYGGDDTCLGWDSENAAENKVGTRRRINETASVSASLESKEEKADNKITAVPPLTFAAAQAEIDTATCDATIAAATARGGAGNNAHDLHSHVDVTADHNAIIAHWLLTARSVKTKSMVLQREAFLNYFEACRSISAMKTAHQGYPPSLSMEEEEAKAGYGLSKAALELATSSAAAVSIATTAVAQSPALSEAAKWTGGVASTGPGAGGINSKSSQGLLTSWISMQSSRFALSHSDGGDSSEDDDGTSSTSYGEAMYSDEEIAEDTAIIGDSSTAAKTPRSYSITSSSSFEYDDENIFGGIVPTGGAVPLLPEGIGSLPKASKLQSNANTNAKINANTNAKTNAKALRISSLYSVVCDVEVVTPASNGGVGVFFGSGFHDPASVDDEHQKPVELSVREDELWTQSVDPYDELGQGLGQELGQGQGQGLGGQEEQSLDQGLERYEYGSGSGSGSGPGFRNKDEGNGSRTAACDGKPDEKESGGNSDERKNNEGANEAVAANEVAVGRALAEGGLVSGATDMGGMGGMAPAENTVDGNLYDRNADEVPCAIHIVPAAEPPQSLLQENNESQEAETIVAHTSSGATAPTSSADIAAAGPPIASDLAVAANVPPPLPPTEPASDSTNNASGSPNTSGDADIKADPKSDPEPEPEIIAETTHAPVNIVLVAGPTALTTQSPDPEDPKGATVPAPCHATTSLPRVGSNMEGAAAEDAHSAQLCVPSDNEIVAPPCGELVRSQEEHRELLKEEKDVALIILPFSAVPGTSFGTPHGHSDEDADVKAADTSETSEIQIGAATVTLPTTTSTTTVAATTCAAAVAESHPERVPPAPSTSNRSILSYFSSLSSGSSHFGDALGASDDPSAKAVADKAANKVPAIPTSSAPLLSSAAPGNSAATNTAACTQSSLDHDPAVKVLLGSTEVSVLSSTLPPSAQEMVPKKLLSTPNPSPTQKQILRRFFGMIFTRDRLRRTFLQLARVLVVEEVVLPIGENNISSPLPYVLVQTHASKQKQSTASEKTLSLFHTKPGVICNNEIRCKGPCVVLLGAESRNTTRRLTVTSVYAYFHVQVLLLNFISLFIYCVLHTSVYFYLILILCFASKISRAQWILLQFEDCTKENLCKSTTSL